VQYSLSPNLADYRSYRTTNPVCLSPMINSRWPRPIGTRLSTALMPVCMGSFTEIRGMMPGALTPTRALNFPVNAPCKTQHSLTFAGPMIHSMHTHWIKSAIICSGKCTQSTRKFYPLKKRHIFMSLKGYLHKFWLSNIVYNSSNYHASNF